MDIAYHYPPDLFELLIETIPRLVRAKKSVLDFFRGAGVEPQFFIDLEEQLSSDPKALHKFGMTRIVLHRLNEKGELTLRERREILKRVVEFEDFSTCWPNDQLKAKGLVSQVRELVDKKDFLTRVRQERDAERQKHREGKKKQLRDLRNRRAELDRIKDDFYRLFGTLSSGAECWRLC